MEEVEEELNIQHSTFNVQRRIEEILNAEKLDTCLRRYDKTAAGMTEKRVGHIQDFSHPGACD